MSLTEKNTNVDQQTQRRLRTGLIAYDREKAFEGYTLFTPISSDGTVYLIDMEGNVVHKWNLPYPPGQYGYILENGNLFYNAWTLPDSDDRCFPFWPLYKGGALVEVNWNSEIVWEYNNENHSHDARRLKNGNTILLCIEKAPEGIIDKIKGGLPGSESESGFWTDRIIEINPEGEIVWDWHSWEHVEELINHPITDQDCRDHWPMGNSIEVIPSGDILVSFRNISTVVIISKETGKIIWKLGHDVVAQQHAPTWLDNGNILIFDNGSQRKSDPSIYSRVIEVDPKTSEIVWEYQDNPKTNFFSSYVSGVRRLPNGNTLITEGFKGRLFEVTKSGEVVWEYINPYFSEYQEGRIEKNFINNQVFRSYRYAPSELLQLKK
ncbi:hypothetical protein CLPU_21c00150 [Gottschalkia purinilytica]|uniref:Arylsulfotransferase n=1 Tax=Gottschalkia purinilytica TaxID=1503 RepID=A0A0L0W6T1_GOTPU|nr:aryl-sulfate sulfotransferase [Gottschalkia purinilytica]KNF07197.1 hypothetical protein CLPU_21c00150 [Gottschalkia purinilytica]